MKLISILLLLSLLIFNDLEGFQTQKLEKNKAKFQINWQYHPWSIDTSYINNFKGITVTCVNCNYNVKPTVLSYNITVNSGNNSLVLKYKNLGTYVNKNFFKLLNPQKGIHKIKIDSVFYKTNKVDNLFLDDSLIFILKSDTTSHAYH